MTIERSARAVHRNPGLADEADGVRTAADIREERPAEVDLLIADPTKARERLAWKARTSFDELVRIMVDADLEAQARLSGRRVGGPGAR